MRVLTIIFIFLVVSPVFGGDSIYNVVTVNGKKGLKDEKGNFVISPKYDDIGWTDSTSIPVDGIIGYQKSGSWGLISIEDKPLTSSKYTHLLPFKNKTFIASIKGKFSNRAFYGIINEKGNPIIYFKYYSLKSVNEYLVALSKVDNQFVYGLIDSQGQIALNFKYKAILQVSDHLVKAEQTHNVFHLFNTTSGQQIGGRFTAIKPIDEQHSLIQVDQLMGVLDHRGHILITPNYEIIEKDGEDRWMGKRSTSWSVLNKDNDLIKEISCQELTIVEDRLLIKTSMGEEFLDKELNRITPQPFDDIIDVSGSKVLFRNGGKYSVYDLDKQQHLKGVKFDSAYISNQFIYGANQYNNVLKWALYDTFGVKRTHFDYEIIKAYHERLFAVKRNKYWGFMDRLGKEIVHCVYDHVGEFKEGLVVVKYHGLNGVINKENDWVVLPQKGEINLINTQLYLSKENQTTELRNFSGELIYFTDNQIQFKNGTLVENLTDGQQRIISLEGVFIAEQGMTSGLYENMKYLNDDLIAVKKNGKFGFVNRHYRLQITNRYEDVGHYNDHGTPVKLLGKWGMINAQEEITVQPVYDSILLPIGGLSIVILQNLKGLIDFEGNEILSPKFNEITPLESGEYLVTLDRKYGLVGNDGRQLINAKYDELIKLYNNTVIVKKRGKYGTLTLQGIEAIPNIYDRIQYHEDWQLYFAKKEGEWEPILVH